jgi:dipeptidyl-peptidase 4
MASYLWAPDSAHLLFDSNGRLWLYDLNNGTGVQIGFTGAAPATIPSSRPMANGLVCARSRPLCPAAEGPRHACHRRGAAPNGFTLNGEVDWVYEEELDDAQQLLLVAGLEEPCLSADERDDVPQYPITDWIPTHARWTCSAIRSPAIPTPMCAWAW